MTLYFEGREHSSHSINSSFFLFWQNGLPTRFTKLVNLQSSHLTQIDLHRRQDITTYEH